MTGHNALSLRAGRSAWSAMQAARFDNPTRLDKLRESSTTERRWSSVSLSHAEVRFRELDRRFDRGSRCLMQQG